VPAWCSFDTETCIFCRKADWTPIFGPRLIVRCSCCNVKAVHMECYAAVSGEHNKEESLKTAVILCSEVHSTVRSKLAGNALQILGSS
jgi:hypothetical protein